MANPKVVVETSEGSFTIELDETAAPKTVANFLAYVDDGHYAGTIFHRVINGFMVQGGGYDDQYAKKPTKPPVTNEADNGLLNLHGTVAMARTGEPHSATAQFFVNVADNTFLNHKSKAGSEWGYCVFGKVVDGMDVVDTIKSKDTGSKGPFRENAPLSEVHIIAVTRAS